MRYIIYILLFLAATISIPSAAQTKISNTEIIYHICQRSFYDSDGDLHGDLKGLEQKLDYLQELGITSILLLPLYESVYYHNYFPIDFMKIDPEFGTEADFIQLVKAIHKRGMKIYMDMEIHYVTEDHLWFKDSYKNPDSEYSEYIIYNDDKNEDFESIIFGIKNLAGYDGTSKKVTTLNMYNEQCKRYLYDLFHYWLDPNKDGNFKDGVDGFRIDHMMDNLDWKDNVVPNMFTQFWRPLFQELKARKPAVKIMGEQANWEEYGERYFLQADLDYSFAFQIHNGIIALDKNQIIGKTDTTWQVTPAGKNQIIFIENHDTHRYASLMESDKAKIKLGAAFTLLLKGIPSIYYGQELGMQGTGGFGAYGETDGNDIPRREAFEWFENWDTSGMALWYKDSGPWWDDTNLKKSDGISLEEQQNEEASIWRFYQQLIQLRKSNPALAEGDLQFVPHSNDQIVSFTRKVANQELLVQINLSDQVQKAAISANLFEEKTFKALFGTAPHTKVDTSLNFELAPFAVQVIQIGS